jgi:hypothetical protein
MLKISSQRLPIHFTSNYTFRNRISYILTYLRNIHDYYFKNRNFKLIITLRFKSYLKGIFFYKPYVFDKRIFFYKSSLLHLQLTFLIRYFYTFCSFAHQVLKEIHLILFLDTLRQKWWFHSFVNHIFLSCKFPLDSVFKLSWKFVVLHFIEDTTRNSKCSENS